MTIATKGLKDSKAKLYDKNLIDSEEINKEIKENEEKFNEAIKTLKE